MRLLSSITLITLHHTLTCVGLEAIETACRAERSCFAGNAKSIEHSSWRWGDATWGHWGIHQCISCDYWVCRWFSWLGVWYRKCVLDKPRLLLVCLKKKKLIRYNLFSRLWSKMYFKRHILCLSMTWKHTISNYSDVLLHAPWDF